MDNMDGYEVEEEKKKFQITRGMVILAAVILVVIIVVIIIIVNAVNKNKPEYTTDDFAKLEQRMEEEAPVYVSQKKIELTSEELRIDLEDLLLENGGSIDKGKVKAAKVCKGYVLASKEETEKYNAYIKCGDLYTTSGYVSNNKNDTPKKTTTKKDTEKPVITIKGNKEVVINEGSKYNDEGATAMDNVDGDVTSLIKVTNNVNVNKPGSYTVIYTVTDKAGNRAEETRKVTVVASSPITTKKTTTKKQSSGGTKPKTTTTKKVTTPPTITLRGSTYVTLNVGERWNDPGYSAKDAKGVDITSRVNVSGSVNTSNAGTYTIRYSVTDSYGNSSSKTRTVIVKSNYIKLQSISLTPNTLNIKVGASATLIVSFNPSNATNKMLTWSSSNASVATVSNGVVKGIKAGTATITAKGADGVSKSVTVIVK